MTPAARTAESPVSAVRTIEIKPPSARGEGWAVARAAFHIVYWSALIVSGHARDPRLGSASPAAAAVSPIERRFQDLDARDQRLYREISEGMIEAEALRSPTGSWPSAEVLAQRGVPPFAADPLDRAHYTWTLVTAKTVANYVGRPAPAPARPLDRSALPDTPGDPSTPSVFQVIITEPDPGTAQDPTAIVDDIHHRLADGTMMHVTVWLGPSLEPSAAPASVADVERGFRQIVVSK